jgi:hypothetical protein
MAVDASALFGLDGYKYADAQATINQDRSDN